MLGNRSMAQNVIYVTDDSFYQEELSAPDIMEILMRSWVSPKRGTETNSFVHLQN